MTEDQVANQLLLVLLDGATFANAMRRDGRPCRIQLPDNPEACEALVTAHLRATPSTLTFVADGREPWREEVSAVTLASFCPAADGLCRWVAIDLDGADHGPAGLVDPIHAACTIAERAADAGLLSGLLVARSRREQGRHVVLILPEPAALPEAVLGVAALVAAAFRIAASDVVEYGASHAFQLANHAIACPGDAGAVELIPRSSDRPRYGWALTLPAAGAFRPHGGGVIVDPFEDKPVHHTRVPRCDGHAWQCLVTENRQALHRIQRQHSQHHTSHTDPLRPQRLHPLTDEFLAGRMPKGTRNTAAFAAACSLLRSGLPLCEVERQILHGARGCELPEREARSAIRSALRTVEQSQ